MFRSLREMLFVISFFHVDEELVQEIEHMKQELFSSQMVLLNVLTEKLYDSVRVALDFIKKSIRKNFTHGQDFKFSDADFVQIIIGS